MNIRVMPHSQTPIYIQIKNQIREMILKGELLDGFLLPSERKMAEKTGTHRNTIIKAYQELKADGFINAFQGVGYKVTYKSSKMSLNQKSASIPWQYLIRNELLDQQISFDNLFSKSYSKKTISFAGGIVPAEAYHKEDIRAILADIINSENESIYEYTPYQGLYELRKNICGLLREKGVKATPSEIQILSETNQALDYLAELFIVPGDIVITEEPLSPDVYRTFRLAGANVVTVPIDEEGIITDILEQLCIKYSPKLIYVNSSFHDPTGIIMSLKRRKNLLDLLCKYRIPIIEDDCASCIRFSDNFIPTIKALDKNNSVIYIYSFALTFAPGLTLAYVAASKQVIKRLRYLLSMHLISLDSLTQNIISNYIERGLYTKNMKDICACYQSKRDLMCMMLKKAKSLGIKYNIPEGGVYIWCRLSDKMDPHQLIRKASMKGVCYIPGTVFFPCGTKGDNYIRLNYSYPALKQIEKGITLLVEAMKESM